MIANGSSTSGDKTKYAIATNKAGATIEINKEGTNISKNNFGMLATNQAEVINKGTVKIGLSTGSVGMAALKQGSTHSTAKNEGTITVDGPEATGVYNTGHFLMDNINAKINVKGSQSIGLYAQGIDATHTKTELKQGTVKSENGAVALYSDQADITLDNTSGNLKLVAGKGGLLFYNYKSSNPNDYAGQFTISKSELKQILQLKETVKIPVSYEELSGNFKRVVNLNKNIGTIKPSIPNVGGQPTNYMIIYTDRMGNLITTYPIPKP